MKRFETSDGLSLAYADAGQGRAVLCLPGLTRNMEDFEPMMAALEGRYRLIRLDARGRGASDYAADFHTYNAAVEARDALELLDHLGLENVALIGTSRGGIVGMLMCALRPGCLSALIFNDVGPEFAAEGLGKIMEYLGRPPAARTLDEAGAALARFYEGQFTGVGPEQWRAQAARSYAEGPDGLKLRYDPKLRDALEAQTEAGPLPDLWPLFDATAGVPLGLIWGVNSDLLSAQTVEKMQARRPDMRLARVPGRGHVPFLNEPEAAALIHIMLGAET